MDGRLVIARHEVIAAYSEAFCVKKPSQTTLVRLKRAAGLVSWQYWDLPLPGTARWRRVTAWADPRVLMMSSERRREVIDSTRQGTPGTGKVTPA